MTDTTLTPSPAAMLANRARKATSPLRKQVEGVLGASTRH